MVNNLTVNALGCIVLVLILSACSSTPAIPINVTSSPIERPELILPTADNIKVRKVDWTVITPENSQSIFSEVAKTGKPATFFALSDKGYESLALNLNDFRTYIQQQKSIISAYENYYKQSTEALDLANQTIKTQADTVNSVAPQKKTLLQQIVP